MGGRNGRVGVLPRLLLTVAAVVLPVAMLAVWSGAVASDTDRYVATVGPLADDPAVQTAVSRRLERAALDAVDAPPRAEALVGEAVGLVVEEVVGSAAFGDAWREANRSAHVELVTLLEDGSTDNVVTEDGRVSIEIATLRGAIVELLAAQGVDRFVDLPEVTASFPIASADDLQRVRDGYLLLDAAALWLPLLWLGLVAVALLLARGRAAAWRWLGAGSLLGGLALLGALPVARAVVVDQVPGPADQAVVGVVWDVLVTDLRTAAWVVVALAAVVLVGGLVGGLVAGIAGGRRTRAVGSAA